MERRAVKRSVIISASAAAVWKAITEPEKIRKNFFGTEVATDWKKDSAIIFSGSWKGKQYHDKGTILDIEKNKRLAYTQCCGLWIEDIPESDFTVIYELEERENDTILAVTQAGCLSNNSHEHSAQYWETVLQKIKEMVEQEVMEVQTVS